MTIDDILKVLAPLTPAVLPVVTFIWYRTRQELHAIRAELGTVRQMIGGEGRLTSLVAVVEALRAEAVRTEALRLVASGHFDDDEGPGIGVRADAHTNLPVT